MQPIITRTERTDAEVDNSTYEIKTPYEVKDDYGNIATFYKKEVVLCTEYDATIAKQQEELVKQQEELQTKVEIINNL